MSSDPIERLRSLRRLAHRLNETFLDDLSPFLHARDKLTFRRLPTSKSKKDDVNVATSCTLMMALHANKKIDRVYKPIEKAKDAFLSIYNAPWESSGLADSNPFTAAMIIRTASCLPPVLRKGIASIRRDREWGTLSRPTLKTIFARLVAKAPESLGIDSSLRANPALGYWLIDGADALSIDVAKALPDIARWAADEFRLQVSLVSAHDDVIMDPIAMAMAACVTERLRTITSLKLDGKVNNDVRRVLPSRRELIHGLTLLFKEQQPSGIWDKYFPMFYYKKEGGANYCFAFELLEAILNEFGTSVLQDDLLLAGVERACRWCEENRLKYVSGGKTYCGWNAGQQVASFLNGEPESWATGVVHMFLARLRDVCSDEIQRLILGQYRADYPRAKSKKEAAWEKYIDADVELRNEEDASVKGLIEKHIIESITESQPDDRADARLYASWLRTLELGDRRSALLFGPPGTSKTTIVRAVAEKLKWPFVEITPSHFLRKGLEQIYVEADKIFDDLMDLRATVVFFDEMDALVQRRGGSPDERLDVTRQFLTTSMLPKLAKLHENKRVVFFMATNHRRQFDEAIIRPGRFDLLICMGPPSLKTKLKKCAGWLKIEDSEGVTVEQVRDVLAKTAKKKGVEAALDLFTILEMRELIDYMRRREDGLSGWVTNEADRISELAKTVMDWAQRSITLRDGSDVRTEYDQHDKRASKVQ